MVKGAVCKTAIHRFESGSRLQCKITDAGVWILSSFMRTLKRPLGVILLGGFNFIILGAASFISSLVLYINFSASKGYAPLSELQTYFPELTLTPEQLKAAVGLQMVVALLFAVSGLGVLLRKEWARKLTLGFSFVMALLALLTALANLAFIRQAVLQAIYPGILILYFTHKKVGSWFVLSRESGTETKNL